MMECECGGRHSELGRSANATQPLDNIVNVENQIALPLGDIVIDGKTIDRVVVPRQTFEISIGANGGG